MHEKLRCYHSFVTAVSMLILGVMTLPEKHSSHYHLLWRTWFT